MNANNTSHNDDTARKQQIPINYGIDNTSLDKALGYLVESQTEINRRMALGELKKAKVIVPVKLDGSYKFDNGGVTFSDNAKLDYVLIKNAKDEHYCPVFTNAEEFKKFTLDKTGNIVQKFTSVAETVCANDSILKGIVVNPFGSGITIDKELLAGLLKASEGKVSYTTAPERVPYRLFSIPKGTTVAVGTPKNRPDSLIEALSRDMANLKNIKNLLVISEGQYPKKDVFLELCKLYNSNEDISLPQEDNYLFFFLMFNFIINKANYIRNCF